MTTRYSVTSLGRNHVQAMRGLDDLYHESGKTFGYQSELVKKTKASMFIPGVQMGIIFADGDPKKVAGAKVTVYGAPPAVKQAEALLAQYGGRHLDHWYED